GPLHRDVLDYRRFQLVEGNSHACRSGDRHVGLDEAGCYCVYCDSEATELDGECLSEPLNPGFGSGVIGLSPVSQCRGARDVDNPAPAGVCHELLGRTTDQKGATRVAIEQETPLVAPPL